MSRRQPYPLNQSPFYKVTSPRKLAEILNIDLRDLQELLDHKHANFNLYERDKPGGGKRQIEEPKPRLQALHKRVCKLLCRIEVPEYLHSAIKGRSYLSNAAAHAGGEALVKVDVKKFFRSVDRHSVYLFFFKQMKCAPDVAGMLSRLLTVDGHLPTGSSASPIISYFAYNEMFDEIYRMARARGLTMTVYVDDLAISGPTASRKLLYEVRRVVARHKLRTHKAHYFRPSRPKVVTGWVVMPDGLRLPNRRHKRIKDDYEAMLAARTPEEKLAILTPLISRVFEAAQIDPSWSRKGQTLIGLRKKYQRELNATRNATVTPPLDVDRWQVKVPIGMLSP